MTYLTKIVIVSASSALATAFPAQANSKWASHFIEQLVSQSVETLSHQVANLPRVALKQAKPTQLQNIAYHADQAKPAPIRGVSDFMDYRPFENDFVISVGKYAGEAPLNRPDDFHVNDALATFDHGTLGQEVTFDDAAPFIGIGYQTGEAKQAGWDFEARAGAAMLGTGDLSLRAIDGRQALDPAIIIELESAMAPFNQQLNSVDLYPVVQLEVKYTF